MGENGKKVLTDDLYKINGTGWLPIDLGSIPGGSPISSFPVDPVNSINIPKDLEGDNCIDDDDLIYRYTCFPQALSYEIDARLESREFTVVDDKSVSDGGTNSIRYEIGTALNLLP